ncbi:MAG: O-antigen ligase family protein [Methylotenera sp.]|nr:O-antigen ligase family protein [Methylotenera sp.]
MDSQSLKTHIPKLVMTDYLFLFGMTLAVCWAVDAFNWQLEFRGFLKHLPLILTLPAFVLAFVGFALFKKQSTIDIPNKTLNSIILLFATFVTIGSLYARYINGIQNSFLTLGMYAFMAPISAWFIVRSQNPNKLIKCIVLIYVFWALLAIFMQFIKFGGLAVFHSREHLVLAGVSVLYFLAPSKFSKFMVISLIALGAFAGHKNTAYMIALLLFFCFFMISSIVYVEKIKDRFIRWMFWFKSIFLLAISSLTIGLAYLYVKSTLPDGNPGYRLHTYEIAWNKFLSSPIWGNGYTRAATEEFDLFTVATSTQVLPTHSDPLDIIANGGLIGFMLWFSVYVILIDRWYFLVRHPDSQSDKTLIPYIHASFCITFSGLIACMFNPVITSSPNNAWACWAIVGILIVTANGKPKTIR